ncbi:hypothetical protein IG631_11475 [Alternaria alternata]|nr:hypothetical protein IG631_11475 [Alternaria alternata]
MSVASIRLELEEQHATTVRCYYSRIPMWASRLSLTRQRNDARPGRGRFMSKSFGTSSKTSRAVGLIGSRRRDATRRFLRVISGAILCSFRLHQFHAFKHRTVIARTLAHFSELPLNSCLLFQRATAVRSGMICAHMYIRGAVQLLGRSERNFPSIN